MSARAILHTRPAVSKVHSVTELGLQTRLLQALRKPRMDDSRPDVLIGVDGGSTKTHCVVLSCSSLSSIASVTGGGCNRCASFRTKSPISDQGYSRHIYGQRYIFVETVKAGLKPTRC